MEEIQLVPAQPVAAGDGGEGLRVSVGVAAASAVAAAPRACGLAQRSRPGAACPHRRTGARTWGVLGLLCCARLWHALTGLLAGLLSGA